MKSISRLHSDESNDCSWRRDQAYVDADIENLSQCSRLSQLVRDLENAGMPLEEQIEHIKKHAIAVSLTKNAAE